MDFNHFINEYLNYYFFINDTLIYKLNLIIYIYIYIYIKVQFSKSCITALLELQT